MLSFHARHSVCRVLIPFAPPAFLLLETGIYTIPDAAELVGAPQASVRVWVEGHTGKQEPHFVGAGVHLREVRKIMSEARTTLRHPHPFATKTVFKTDGRKIVAEIARRNGLSLVYDLKSKNFEMPSVVMKSFLEHVVFDPRGEAIESTPRPKIAPNVIVHPRIEFSQPVLKHSNIPTQALAKAVKVEGNARFVADIFDISERHVREAVKFEEHLAQAA